MEQSPWAANSHSRSQEIPRLLWILKDNFRVHKNLPLVLVLSQMNPVHTFPPYLPKIQSSIIHTFKPRSSAWYLPFGFSDQNFVCISHLSHASYVPCPSQLPWLDYFKMLWSVQVMKLLIMKSSPVSHHFLPLRSKYFPLTSPAKCWNNTTIYSQFIIHNHTTIRLCVTNPVNKSVVK